MDIISRIAEQKILEAIERGELKNLAYAGKPVEIENLSNIPEELRMGYKILKNAHFLPEELELKKETLSLQDLIDCCHSPEEREHLKNKLSEKAIRFNILMEKRRRSRPALSTYRKKIYQKFGW
ncbi:DnaJ family domain-containing protein [Dehalobacterium formicoaceticum]|uniref:DnaJ family domain-containing protein n=1 Tax=Dehalobacterium formicoaceticum TaxID=51515 RepID=UPI0031F65342